MRQFDAYWLMAAVIFGVLLTAGAPAALGQACTCDTDIGRDGVNPCAGLDGAVSSGDLNLIKYCVENQSDFCGRPLSVCDINCDGVVDYRDYGEVLDDFPGVPSGSCLGVYGACCADDDTNCELATSLACNIVNTVDIPGDGDYKGDGTACDPSPCDCNRNDIQDDLDLIDGTSFDCNKNGLLDECDIDHGFATDTDPANGIPDECDKFNRYLFFTMNDLVPAPNPPYAIRVTLLNVNGFDNFNNDVRWAGAPFDTVDEDLDDPTRTFKAANLECSSHYTDWGTSELVYIAGGELVPGSLYTIQAIGEACDEAQEGCYTPADRWIIATGLWGDVLAPFTGSESAQPDFIDIAGVVAKFVATPGALPKPRFQLLPNTTFPDRSVDFKDISATVAAFVGTSYADVVGSGVGPCTCPSSVTCGATTCLQELDCGDGFCVAGVCTDPCRRCSP